MDFEAYIESCIVKILPSRQGPDGTGFWVLPDGYCLTCYHVIENQRNQQSILIEYNGRKLKVGLNPNLSHPEADIAVLQLTDEKDLHELLPLPFVPLGDPSMDVDIRFFGYRRQFLDGYRITAKLRPGQHFTTVGKVFNLETYLPNDTTVQGMSGAPVFDPQRKVVIGIQYSQEKPSPALCYAHPMEKVYNRWPQLREKNEQQFAVLDISWAEPIVSTLARREIPKPPRPYFHHNENKISPDTNFSGRKAELQKLNAWVRSKDSIMLIDALGGVGKTYLAYEWTKRNTADNRRKPKFAGVIWFSMYESDGTLGNVVHATLAYIMGGALDEVKNYSRPELENLLLTKLKEKPYLIILDGLERRLIASLGTEASRGGATSLLTTAKGSPSSSIDPADDRVLSALVNASPSKILITSRIIPKELEGRIKNTLKPGVRRLSLKGLDPEDAIDMMRLVGIHGDTLALKNFMEKFDYHGLYLMLAAKQITAYTPARGNFDEWLKVHYSDFLVSNSDGDQHRDNILEFAFKPLSRETARLINRIAFFQFPVDYGTLAVLNPYLDISKADQELDKALNELEERGLLQGADYYGLYLYNLHPIIRSYAYKQLSSDERLEICNRVYDHFTHQLAQDPERISDVFYLRRAIEIYRALTEAGRFDDAAQFYLERLKPIMSNQLNFSYYHILELLALLFPGTTTEFSGLPKLSTTENQTRILQEAYELLSYVGRTLDALALISRKMELNQGNASIVSQIADFLHFSFQIAYSMKFALARGVVDIILGLEECKSLIEDEDYAKVLFNARRYSFELYNINGQWEAAEKEYQHLLQKPPHLLQEKQRNEIERCRAEMLIHQGFDASKTLEAALELSVSSQDTHVQHQIHFLQGELAIQGGPEKIKEAIHHLSLAVEMAEAEGSGHFAHYRAMYARALALRKRRKFVNEARNILKEVISELTEPEAYDLYSHNVYISVAETYLAIGDEKDAARFALKAYNSAWAGGYPYVSWWNLQRAKTVLNVLGIKPPNRATESIDEQRAPYINKVRVLVSQTLEMFGCIGNSTQE